MYSNYCMKVQLSIRQTSAVNLDVWCFCYEGFGLIKSECPCWSFATQRPSAFYKCSFVHVHPNRRGPVLFVAIEEKKYFHF